MLKRHYKKGAWKDLLGESKYWIRQEFSNLLKKTFTWSLVANQHTVKDSLRFADWVKKYKHSNGIMCPLWMSFVIIHKCPTRWNNTDLSGQSVFFVWSSDVTFDSSMAGFSLVNAHTGFYGRVQEHFPPIWSCTYLRRACVRHCILLFIVSFDLAVQLAFTIGILCHHKR